MTRRWLVGLLICVALTPALPVLARGGGGHGGGHCGGGHGHVGGHHIGSVHGFAGHVVFVHGSTCWIRGSLALGLSDSWGDFLFLVSPTPRAEENGASMEEEEIAPRDPAAAKAQYRYDTRSNEDD